MFKNGSMVYFFIGIGKMGGKKKKKKRRTTMVKVSPTIISQNEKYQGNMTGLLFMRGD